MLESFGTFIKTKQAPLVSQRAEMPVRHPSANPTLQAKAKMASGNVPKVTTAKFGAAQASKRSSRLLTGLNPRITSNYGFGMNGNGSLSKIRSDRLARLYRGRAT